jgi:hypothetical protein
MLAFSSRVSVFGSALISVSAFSSSNSTAA